MKKKKNNAGRKHIPERFCVAKSTLLFDRLMTAVIMGGGVLVIASVFGICLFILLEILPLMGGAGLSEKSVISSPVCREVSILPDLRKNWTYIGNEGNRIHLIDAVNNDVACLNVGLKEGEHIVSADVDSYRSIVLSGTDQGRILLTNSSKNKEIRLKGNREAKQLSFAFTEDRAVFVTVEGEEGGVFAYSSPGYDEVRNDGPETRVDLTRMSGTSPRNISLSFDGEKLIVLKKNGDVAYLVYDDDEEEWECRQILSSPFGKDVGVTIVGWIYGGESILIGGDDGSYGVFSIYPQKQANGRNSFLFRQTKYFKPLNGAVRFFEPSQVNRCFLVGSQDEIRFCQATTGENRIVMKKLGFSPQTIKMSEGFDQMFIEDSDGQLRHYKVNDEYSEASFMALFCKVWYEGYPSPEWQWQSVGGSDTYEPKMSLIPLIFGTLKGTFYSLLFAVPVALMAAVYTANFMTARVKSFVKPVMEIMASLPSVVLGFFGALYIAPMIEDKIPAILSMVILIPAVTICFGLFCSSRSPSFRNRYGKGMEYVVLIPAVFLVAWLCWDYVGFWFEPMFVKTLCLLAGCSGEGDILTFPDLWRNGFDLAYEQRNSLVVGFIMGFAVIPVIFTIAEDSLSNVPPALINASEALGASRWQVVKTVVLPVAAAGIFSALMIGLGRAIGETMIVLMATGNTPIMDWNIFNGMRTLSANIATELPEAAEHSIHYRVLFLCAFILFAMTFVLNTVAEILRSCLRERYKVI